MAGKKFGISHLSAQEVKEKMNDPQDRAILIDVREVDEYVEGHVPNVPLIPMGEIAQYIDEFDKTREYIFICRSGQRSLKVAHFFKENQFELVHNLDGGMLEWTGEISVGPEKILHSFDEELLEK